MEFLNVIILLGALQGFIISGLLFFGKAKSLSHRILAFLILIISLACLNLYLFEIGLPGKSSFWSDISVVIPLVLAMPIGPLIYFYVHTLLVPGFSFAKRDRLHFYPILLDLLPRFIGVVYLVAQATNWLTGDQRIMLVSSSTIFRTGFQRCVCKQYNGCATESEDETKKTDGTKRDHPDSVD